MEVSISLKVEPKTWIDIKDFEIYVKIFILYCHIRVKLLINKLEML